MTKEGKGVRFDPSKHVRNRNGRWVTKDGGAFVRLDRSTIPDDAPPGAVGADLEGVELPHAEPFVPPVAAEVAPPAAPPAAASTVEPAAPAAASTAEPAAPAAGGFESLPSMDPEVVDVGSVPGGAMPGGVGASGHSHAGCHKARAEGELCSCGVRVFPPPSPQEIEVYAGLLETGVNRMTRYPRPFDADEKRNVEGAVGLFVARYGGAMGSHAPALIFVGTMAAVATAREDKPPVKP